jgi:hypothetical protein
MAKIIGRVGIKVVPEVDNRRARMREELNRQLDDLDNDIKRRKPSKLNVEVDKDGVDRDLDRIVSEQDRKNRKLTLEVDAKYKDALRNVKKEFGDTLSLKVDYSSMESVKDARRQLERELSGLRATKLDVKLNEEDLLAAKHKLDAFINDADDNKIELPIGLAGTALAAARLSYLTRPRTVSIIAKVSGKSVAVAEGVLRSLAGLNVLQRVGTGLENVARNFDKFALKGTSMLGVVGSLTDALGYMVTTLFSVGGGVAQAVGLFAMLPTLGASVASTFTILSMAFNNIGQSFSDIPIVAQQALAKLPPAARKARNALAGVYTDIRDPVQNLFWEEIGTSLQDFVHRILPEVKRGLLQMTPHVARFAKGFLDSFTEIAKKGEMRAMFTNLSKGFDEAVGAAKPLADAINTFGLRGSFFLPRMGKWVKNLARDFNDWTQEAEKAGDIDRWIEQGISSFKDMGRVINGVTRQFQAITQIVNQAGGQSLSGFATNMQSWADVMEREPFRSRMTAIFKGARDGASKLNVGVKNLGTAFGEASGFVQGLLDKLGELGGDALTRVADLFSQDGFQNGVLRGVTEIDTAIKGLGPTAKAAGRLIGTAFDVGGTVIQNLVPLLTTASRILDNMLRIAGPGLEALSGPLSRLLNNGLLLAEGPLMGVANAIRFLGDTLAPAPKAVQNLVAALGAFILLRGRLGGALLAATAGFANLGNKLQGNNIRYGVQKGVVAPLKELPVGVLNVAKDTEKATGRLGMATKGIGSKLSGVGRALGGFLSLGGGLVGGLAIMGIFTAIATGIGMVGEAAAANEEKISSVQDTLDNFGNPTQATAKLNAGWMAKTVVAWGDGAASLLQILDDIGIGSESAIKRLGGTAQDYKSLIADVSRELEGVKAAGEAYLQSQLDKGITDLSGDETWKNYQRQADGIARVKKELEAYQRVQDIARLRQEAIAKATGTTTGTVARFGDAMAVLGDEMATTSSKADALNGALDILGGGTQSKQAAAIALADSIRGIGAAIKNAKDGKIKLTDLIEKDGSIKVDIKADPSGLKARLAQELSSGVRDALGTAFATADTVPPAARTQTFAKAYETALSGIRAKIEPQLDADPGKARAKFDSFLKANGWDKTTVEALIDGKVNQAELAKLPPEIRKFLEGWMSANPAEVPVDADTTDLVSTVTAAGELLKQLGASRTTPTIDADGAPIDKKTQAAIGLLRKVGASTTVAQIDANADKLDAKQKAALRKLTGIDSYQAIAELEANGKPLEGKVRDAIARLLGLSREKPTPKLDANGKPLNDKVNAATAKGNALARKKFNPLIDADKGRFEAKAAQVWAKGTAIDRARWIAQVTANVSGIGAVDALARAIQSVRSKHVTVGVTTTYTSKGRQPKGAVARPGVATYFADGGINQSRVKSFADGGISTKPTSAHIARAGSYVTYAEKETGGEAFIPLSASKRGRSTAILNEVAKMFGLSLVNAQMADGGINGSAAPIAGAMVSIGQMVVADPDEATRKIRNSQRDALAMQNLGSVI